MSTKTVITRIKNKADLLSAWQGSTTPLLNGEIAIVRVPTGESYTNPVTGKSEPVVELLMKVGDGTSAFANLPWLSAKASDVYNWAKNPTVEDVPVTITVGSTSTAGTLGGWLKSINDQAAANAANIASNDTDIATLSGKVDVDKVSTAISSAVDTLKTGLTHTGTQGTNQIVKAVTQANGKVTVTYGTISEAELPDISASKVKVDSSTTLATKLSAMDAAITANTDKLAGHTDAAINALIDNKINALDYSDSGSGYVTAVTQEDGKISVTKSALPTGGTEAGIVKLGVTGGAATYDAVDSLTTRVSTAEGEITSLKNSISGGVHFIGTTTTELVDGTAVGTVTVDNKSHIPSAGDVVIYGEKEFIWNGSAWKELGDLTRVGTLETKLDNLDYDGGATGTSKFVTKVTQVDGKISAEYAQPSATDVTYDSNSTVKAKIDANSSEIAKKANSADVYTKTETGTQITNAINELTATSSGSGNFVIDVTQSAGKVTVTKGNLPSASTGAAGIVQLSSATNSDSEDVAATPNAVKSAYTLADQAKADAAEALAAAQHDHPYAASSHTHGNIANDGTITSTDVTSATGVLVYDSNNKIQRATAAQTRAIIGAGTSSLELGTTSTTAAKGDHTHSTYEARMTSIENNFANYAKVGADNKLYYGADEIIFDCGGAPQ